VIFRKHHNLYQQDTELVKNRRKSKRLGEKRERRMIRKIMEADNQEE
jgi:hypothetical protein